ncbi:MAG: hypothetical protein ACR2QJ_05160 [Geminicoccaceae bacterium]
MTKEDSSPKSKKDDNLEAIKGIGPERRKFLAKVFGIHTFSELAGLSVGQIEAALEGDKGPKVARSGIRKWLNQAEKIAAASRKTSDWEPFASFVVEYRRREADDAAEDHQTHVHHVEDDENGTWPGLEAEALGPWMLGRAERAAVPEREADDHGEAPETLDLTLPPDAKIAVRLTQVQIRQPVNAEPVSLGGTPEAPSGFIKSTEPFALDATFELIGPDAPDLTKRAIPYICQFYARDLATGASIPLGDTMPGSLVKGQLAYGATLYSATLQEGAYRMDVLTIVQSSPPVPGHLEVPILQAF